jgi:hypothetical protein
MGSPEPGEGEAQLLVAEPVELAAGFEGLRGQHRALPRRLDGPAPPVDQSHAEVHGGAVEDTNAAHRVRLGRAVRLGWVVTALYGRQVGFHGGNSFAEDAKPGALNVAGVAE